MIEVKKLSKYDVGAGLMLATESIEDLKLKDETFDPMMFNFKIKNMFVTPGVTMFGLFEKEEMIGFVVLSDQQMLWTSLKKVFLEFLYFKRGYRSEENVEYILELLEKMMIEDGYESVIVGDDNPFVPHDLLDKRNYKVTKRIYEKHNAY